MHKLQYLGQYNEISQSVTVHILNVDMGWDRMGVVRPIHSNLKTWKHYLNTIYCLIYKTHYLYLHRLDFSLQLFLHFFFLGIHTFLKSSFCISKAFFLVYFPASFTHFHMCKCNFYENVFLYEKNKNFVIIFSNMKCTMRSVIHGRGVVLQAGGRDFPDPRYMPINT